jgi:uncharacterized damage-inducible protein DinB
MRRERRRKKKRRRSIRTAIGKSEPGSKGHSVFLPPRRAWNDNGNSDLQVEGKLTPQEMRVLYDYNAWANHRSLEAASALTADKFVQPMGSSFGSVRDTLGHIFGAEWIWLERFQGRSPASLPDTTQFKDAASLLERWNEHETRLLTFVRGLTQTDLDRVLEYKTLKYGVYSNPLWQSMQHVVNHGSYHRGQVTTLLRQLGVQPILTDLMHFYRERATAAGA